MTGLMYNKLLVNVLLHFDVVLRCALSFAVRSYIILTLFM